MGSQRSPILWIPFYLYTHPLTQNCQIWRDNICGEVACFRGQPCPYSKGRGPSAPQFYGFPSVYVYPIDAESPITNFWASFLSVWSGLDFLGKPRPHSKRRDPSAPQFLGFPGFPSIYAHIFCRRNAKFDVGTHVGLVYWGQSRLPFQESWIPAAVQFCGFSGIKFGTVTNMESGRVLEGQPSLFICRNESRGLSATAEFLV